MIEGFLLGTIATASFVAGLYFLKFWRRTRDFLFLSFGVAFLIETANRIAVLFVSHPNEGAAWIYLVRLFAFLLILGAIIRKNYGADSR